MREDTRSSATLDLPGSATYGYLTRWCGLPEQYRPAADGVDHSLDSLALAIAEGLSRRR